MVLENVNAYSAFGYHKVDEIRNAEDILLTLMNINNALSYIPIIGTIIGIVRLIIFSKFYSSNKEKLNEESKKFYIAQISRGLFELTSCGFLLSIPDLIITLKRNKPMDTVNINFQARAVSASDYASQDSTTPAHGLYQHPPAQVYPMYMPPSVKA
jgi:hypothetical protein